MKVEISNFNQLNLAQQEDGLCVGCTHFVDKDDWSTEYICNNFGCEKINCFECDGFNPDEYAKRNWKLVE